MIASLLLFRLTGSGWPMYLLVAMGVIHAYSVVFSRGEALTNVTVLFASVTVVWALCVLTDRLAVAAATQAIVGPIWSCVRKVVQQLPIVIPSLLWLGGSVWGVSLGRSKAMPGVKIASSFFLGTGTFVLGLWAVWAILIQSEMFRTWVFQVAVVFALVVPLVLLIVLLRRRPPEAPRAHIVALWLLVIATYLASTQLLTDLVEKGLGVFLPRLLGLPPLGEVDLPWLVALLNWRMPLCSTLTAVSIISLVASSVAQVIATFEEGRRPGFCVEALADIAAKKAEAKSQIEGLLFHIAGMGLEAVAITVAVATVARRITVSFLENLVITLRRALVYLRRLVRHLVIPVCSFSLLAVLIIMTLEHSRVYNAGEATFSPLALWGESLTVMLVALVLCGASFGFAPAAKRRFVFGGTEAVAVLESMAYVLVSLASLGLPLVWLGFRSAGVDFAPVRPGPLYTTNLVAASGVLVLLILTVMAPSTQADAIRRRIPAIDRVTAGIQVASLMLFCSVAVCLGSGLMVGSLVAALR